MEDSKLNKGFQDAVRSGSGRLVHGIRSAVRKMRGWQKAGLVLCLISWIVSACIGFLCGRYTSALADQNSLERWAPEIESAQISVFLSGASGMSDETAQAIYSSYNRSLQEDAISLTETQIENGASLIEAGYCGFGNAVISSGEESVNVTMIGVGGDFFNFHPLDLMDGYYFTEDELMQDRVLLDDETAWRLFGSPNVVGMSVEIGGTPHYIAGVFRRPTGRFYKYAGMGDYLVFVSYDSLCKYTETGVPAEDDPDSTDSDQMDARAPAVPVTAAWAPVLSPDASSPAQAFRTGKTEEAAALEDEESGDLTDPGSGEDSGEDASEGEEDSGDDLDEPVPGDTGSNMGGGTYRGDQDDEGVPEKEEVNRSRINCYEVILPDPVSGYALRTSRKCIEEAGVSASQYTIVENSSRFDTFRLASLILQPGIRSMQTAAIQYPYWENVARAWEDTLIPFALLQLILRFAPILFLLYLILWYATHKTWTLTGIAGSVRDRIYDLQSERIYGKAGGEQALPEAEKQEKLSAEKEEALFLEEAEDHPDPGEEVQTDVHETGEKELPAGEEEQKLPAGEEEQKQEIDEGEQEELSMED